jgi:hypothetical protein
MKIYKAYLKLAMMVWIQQEKQIFLDIACFFIGEERDTAIRIWDGSGWNGWLGFRNLLRLCRLDARATTLVRFIPWPSMLHPHPLLTMKDGHPTATSMPIYSGCQNLRRIHPIFPSAHLQQTSLRHGVNPSRQEFNGVGEFKF